MESIRNIPELALQKSSAGLVRIPPETDVPITPRVRQLLDTPEFRRLTQISQLGLVSLVYPAANHTRHEHSLGVYRTMIDFLTRLADDERFCETVSPHDAEVLLVAALLHDIGHWPFCHPIEDIQLPSVPEHEQFAANYLFADNIATILQNEWNIDSQEVLDILSGDATDCKSKLLRSLLSGPIDVDKFDYLMRDSLHAGVPYGRNFDQARLLRSLCINQAGNGLAISDKGKTAAEMMVFSRYVMFSEVYWHHAVRSATAMLQRAFTMMHESLELNALFRLTERPMIDQLLSTAENTPANELLSGLFGPQRKLFKRLAQYSLFEEPEVYQQLARRPYPWLIECAEHLATLASTTLGKRIAPCDILIDAPPLGLEVEFNLEVFYAKQNVYRRLGDVSPVVRTLAQEQFDDYVKRVRIFVHPRIADELRSIDSLQEMLNEAIQRCE